MTKRTMTKYVRQYEIGKDKKVVARETPLPATPRQSVVFGKYGNLDMTCFVSPGQIINPKKETKRWLERTYGKGRTA